MTLLLAGVALSALALAALTVWVIRGSASERDRARADLVAAVDDARTSIGQALTPPLERLVRAIDGTLR